jgi:hypothetical protein
VSWPQHQATGWLAALALALLAGTSGRAATTATWEMNSFADFLRGRLFGVTLTADGRIRLAPPVTAVYSAEQPQIWTAVRAADGSLYLGTGHRGRVYRVDASGRGSLYWTAPQPEVFALAAQGTALFAAASPGGAVYRIVNGAAEEYFKLPEGAGQYVWSLAAGRDGALYVGVGDPGRIYRVIAKGQGELYFDTEQAHVTALAFDNNGALLAGTEPNGLLYRITARDRAFVLLDANLPEIRSIVPAPDGSLYVAALGGSLAKRTSAAQTSTTTTPTPAVSAPGITITVTDAQTPLELKKPEPPKPQTATAPQPAPVAAFEQAGVEKSAIYRIQPDGTYETLWSSKEENVYDIFPRAEGLWFSTDVQGRVYQANADRSATLIAETGDSEVLRLIPSSDGLLAVTGNAGQVLRLGSGAGVSGSYESPVHDAGVVSRWGRIHWMGEGAIQIRTRTGNSSRPDRTWSDWSAPLTTPGQIPSPNARFLQWKVELSNASASLDQVTVAYLPQNTAPVVRGINVTTLAAAGSKQKDTSASATASFSVTVTDTGEGTAPAGTQAQTAARSGASQLMLSWQADDPEGDKLSFTVSFRGETEREWKPLRANIHENSLALDPDSLADGRYYFRVVASDRPSNSASTARESELVSSPVLIDGTPPTVTAVWRDGAVQVTAQDAASDLRRCEYSIDAGPWLPVEASDGVTDGPEEQFRIELGKLTPGEHLVVVRVTDAAGNAGLAKVVVRP